MINFLLGLLSGIVIIGIVAMIFVYKIQKNFINLIEDEEDWNESDWKYRNWDNPDIIPEDDELADFIKDSSSN